MDVRVLPKQRSRGTGEVGATITALEASGRSGPRLPSLGRLSTAARVAAHPLHSLPPPRLPKVPSNCRPCPTMISPRRGPGTRRPSTRFTTSLGYRRTRQTLPRLDMVQSAVPTRRLRLSTPLRRPWSVSGCSNTLEDESRLAFPNRLRKEKVGMVFDTNAGFGLHRTRELLCGALSSQHLVLL